MNRIYVMPLGRVIAMMLAAVVIWILMKRISQKNNKIETGWRWANKILCVCACLLIVRMTLWGRTPGQRTLVLMPFHTLTTISYNDEAIRTMIMNMALFLPLGLTLPYVFGNRKDIRRKWICCLLIGCGISIAVELVQYCFALGQAETDDVICNTLGCGLGVLADCIYEGAKKNKKIRRVGYKVYNIRNVILLAVYPVTTWVTCVLFTIIINFMLAVIIKYVPEKTILYNMLYALITGATASLLVSVVIEFTNNYNNNWTGWHELQEYYSIILDYEISRQVDMHQTSFQEKYKACDTEDMDELDQPKDVVLSTWNQLPKIIPILKETYEEKKEFLSDAELVELECILEDYKIIRFTVKNRLMDFFLYDALNHADEEYLRNLYPKNIINNMPDWMKSRMASNESEKMIETITDEVMADEFLLEYCMKECDISQESINRYEPVEEEQSDNSELEDWDQEEVDEEDMDEETFRMRQENLALEMRKADIPFNSYIISLNCLEISKSIDKLEKYILRKPYIGGALKRSRELLGKL